jgi:chromate transporter
MAFPGALFTVLMLSVLRKLDEGLMVQIQYAAIGISAFIMCLLTEYIIGTLKNYRRSRFRVLIWCVVVGVFLATGGATLLQILHIDLAVPELSTIQILLLTLLGSIVVGLLRKNGEKKERKLERITIRPLVTRILTWLVFFALLSVPAYLVARNELLVFDMKGMASSLLSFGGGDAYLTIADGLFIPEFIRASEFYNQLVLIVNVLPGSILCKTLTGIGYFFGLRVTGTVLGGIWLALAGFACSVAGSCGVFYIIYHLYDWLESVEVFVVIRKTIRIVVSGLLVTVMMSLIQSGIEMNSNPDFPWYTVLVMIAVLYGINLFLYQKKCSNLIRILVSLALALTASNIMML